MATHRDSMRYETQRNQRAARGTSVHPRSLARSVARFINTTQGRTPSLLKQFREMTMALPKKGRARIKPVARKCHKIDA